MHITFLRAATPAGQLRKGLQQLRFRDAFGYEGRLPPLRPDKHGGRGRNLRQAGVIERFEPQRVQSQGQAVLLEHPFRRKDGVDGLLGNCLIPSTGDVHEDNVANWSCPIEVFEGIKRFSDPA